MIVYTVWRSDDESNHIFSTQEKASAYAESIEPSCVLSEYEIDTPERYYREGN